MGRGGGHALREGVSRHHTPIDESGISGDELSIDDWEEDVCLIVVYPEETLSAAMSAGAWLLSRLTANVTAWCTPRSAVYLLTTRNGLSASRGGSVGDVGVKTGDVTQKRRFQEPLLIYIARHDNKEFAPSAARQLTGCESGYVSDALSPLFNNNLLTYTRAAM